jgi:hypothetical protein
MTRTDAILLAIREAVARRRTLLDTAVDLSAVTLVVKLSPDHSEPRCVRFLPEFETRRGTQKN